MESEKFTSYAEMSEVEWGETGWGEGLPGWEQLHFGALQRIATALEAIAMPFRLVNREVQQVKGNAKHYWELYLGQLERAEALKKKNRDLTKRVKQMKEKAKARAATEKPSVVSLMQDMKNSVKR
jgi:hypothetical protein